MRSGGNGCVKMKPSFPLFSIRLCLIFEEEIKKKKLSGSKIRVYWTEKSFYQSKTRSYNAWDFRAPPGGIVFQWRENFLVTLSHDFRLFWLTNDESVSGESGKERRRGGGGSLKKRDGENLSLRLFSIEFSIMCALPIFEALILFEMLGIDEFYLRLDVSLHRQVLERRHILNQANPFSPPLKDFYPMRFDIFFFFFKLANFQNFLVSAISRRDVCKK